MRLFFIRDIDGRHQASFSTFVSPAVLNYLKSGVIRDAAEME